MTQHRSTAMAFRWSIVAVFAFWVFATGAPVHAASNPSIDGVYNGAYAGKKGPVKFKLTITHSNVGGFTGVLTLYLPEGSATKSYTCDLTGLPPNDRGAFALVPVRGETPQTPPPADVAGTGLTGLFDRGGGLSGLFDPAGGNGAGQISGKIGTWPSPKFEAIRDVAESAKLIAASAAKAPPAGPRGINGVYTCTYNRYSGFPPTNVKFSVKATDDGSLTALFTYDLPDYPGSSVTYKLTGKYVAGAPSDYGSAASSSAFQFTTVEPMGSLALDKNPATHAPFDASKVKEVHVGVVRDGVIDGTLWGQNGQGVCGRFGGTLDPAESANLDKVMAAQLHAATNQPAPVATAKPGIEGVFNGTYRSEKGPLTKFKLTMTHTHQGALVGLAGMATIYLPVGSGTEAYTYNLTGIEVGRARAVDIGGRPVEGTGEFQLRAGDWVTMPPKNFEDPLLKSMGFDGTLVLDPAQKTARIVNVQQHEKDFIPTFEGTWDAMESSDIDGTIAAQKKVDAANLAVAIKARDEAVNNAPPKQLASKDLVRKSRKYWDGYQTDMIREVFDGGFGAAIDENQQFQFLFCTYVEMYSAKYAALLPAKHETVTITRYSSHPDGNGGYIKTAESTSTVEVDSRFAPKYRQFAEGLGSSSGGMSTAIAAMASGANPQDMVNTLLAPKHDMERFFAHHDGKSAAMRQLTENFLRGVTGAPSLQQSDGKIDGADAESDKDLPPGRYARFVDGANAYFRERAEKDPAMFGHNSSHDTAFCQRLAELEQAVMSRQEEYYYANDFDGRFGPIMGPRASCTDPAWPRLHAAYVKAIE